MALTATYDALLSRIRLAASGLNVSSTYAVIDRSTNNFLSSTIIRAGSRVPVSGGVASLDDYEFPAGVPVWYRIRSYSALDVLLTTFLVGPMTQDLTELDSDQVWLKVPAAPYMNRKVTVSVAGDKSRPARSALFPIVGRSKAIAVSDIRSSMSYELKVRTFDYDEESDLDFILASGNVLFFHLPIANKCMTGGYYSAGDVVWGPPGSRARPERVFNIPLTEVVAPGPDVSGSTYTWASVKADYATWAQVKAANATWRDLKQRVGNPGDVIVP